MVNYPAIFVSNGTAILLLLVIIFSSKRSLCNGLVDEKIFPDVVIKFSSMHY